MFRHIRKLYTNNELTTINFMKNSCEKAFGKYLLWTNIVSSGVLLGLGDLIQQEIEYQRKLIPKRYDYARAGRMLLVGLAQGPMHHYFYKYLDMFIPKQDLSSVGKKILIDQLIASPVFIITFFYGMGALEMVSYNEMEKELKDKFLTVYTADWCVWPPTQFINFYYIHPKYRVFYINFVTMIYDIFLSYIKHKDHAQISQVMMK